ncbi:MAG TPA: hypothetical protein VK302_21180 [Terriglobales bacterium]|nr:hypothetical protein [Terriglobales bacterium]
MKRQFTGLCSLALLLLISSTPTVLAQTEANVATPENPLSYEVSKEVTLAGTVASVLAKASPGMLWGSHLRLATASGEVDASLGMWGLRGRGALSVRTGQQIEMTGVMKMIGNRQVFLARTVKVEDRVYALRNEHGIPVPPQSRERVSQKTGQKGETQ